MRLTHPLLSSPIHWSEGRIPVLILEHPRIFRQLVFELSGQAAGEDGEFVLSFEYETLDCGAHLHVLRDHFSLSLDDRKLQNQFQKVLQFTIREELPEATDHLQQEIVRYLGLIAVQMDYPLSFTEGEYILPLLKAVKCQPVLDGEGALEQLMQYMELYSGLMSQQCFALVNAHQYFSREELTELYQMANYQKWHLILLEQIQMPALSCEDIYLVDQNLCEIRVDSE